MERFIIAVVLIGLGLRTLYRGSLFSDLQDGLNKYVNDKDRIITWSIDYYRWLGYALILAGIIFWFKYKA